MPTCKTCKHPSWTHHLISGICEGTKFPTIKDIDTTPDGIKIKHNAQRCKCRKLIV